MCSVYILLADTANCRRLLKLGDYESILMMRDELYSSTFEKSRIYAFHQFELLSLIYLGSEMAKINTSAKYYECFFKMMV